MRFSTSAFQLGSNFHSLHYPEEGDTTPLVVKVRLLSKNDTPVLGCYLTCFEYENVTGVCILVSFQGGPRFSHNNGKFSPRPFELYG